MSYRSEKLMSLAGISVENKTIQELKSTYGDIIRSGIYGLCFSPYYPGQEPGAVISEKQIIERIEIIRPYTKWIRTFSCTDGNELIPRIAHKYGLKTLVGAWLGKNEEINKKEIENVIRIAREGHAKIIAVGNEVMYRNDLAEDDLLTYIQTVKKEVPDIPVGYVDAYYEFENRPAITQSCDVILANCYPFWEGCSAEYSLLYMKDMYRRATKVANGKKVIITETGWPDKGAKFYGAEPSIKNALTYFINAQIWSKEDDIDIFYFSSFDEPWKVSAEGDVGAYWGIWDKNGKPKYE